MNTLAPVAPKIDPLIRRLGSTSDGEVVACVHAVRRQLDRAGLSFHDVADAVIALSDGTEQIRTSSRPVPRAHWQMVEWLHARRRVLRSREHDFITDMRPHCWRENRLRLTEKQARWLEAIYARVWEAEHEC